MEKTIPELRELSTRPTRNLTTKEACADLGVNVNTLRDLVDTGWLHPTGLGKGWKFSQEDICEFQRLSRGLDIRSYAKMRIEKEKIDSAKPIFNN